MTPSSGGLESAKRREVIARHAAAGLFGAFAFLALADAAAIAIAVPLPAAGLSLRLAHHFFDAAETLGVGALVALVAGALLFVLRLPRWGQAAGLFAAHLALVNVVVGGYLRQTAAHVRSGRSETVIFVYGLVVSAVSLTSLPILGSELARTRRLGFVPPALAVAALIVAQTVLRDDYHAIHGLLTWGAVLLAAPSVAPPLVIAARGLRRTPRGRAGLAAIVLVTLVGIVVPPPNATRCELFRQPCAIASWVLATLAWSEPSLHAPVTLPPSRWREDRAHAAPSPPTEPAILPSDAVVVLITIDALRADVLADPASEARYPVLAKLQREGVVFTHASAPGNQTVLSLSATFSGRYFSELRWEAFGAGKTRFFYPAADPSPRFPELLSEHGVATVDLAGLFFFANDYGVARGFREQKIALQGRHVAQAALTIPPLLERIEQARPGPQLLYTHLMETHAPYGTAGQGTDHERYLAQLEVVDRELGKVVSTLERGLGDRWALFVSADHGEAFGDHETYFHSKTLYEELLHVPLIARSPRFSPRVVEARVGLIDLGPTLLDLFGVDTPATFNGQSLVPLLAGGSPTLTRPLLAEGRRRRSLTLADGLKVIADPLRKTAEVYDLARDPGETRNLFDLEPARADAALAELRAFWEVHEYRQEGYTPPYIP